MYFYVFGRQGALSLFLLCTSRRVPCVGCAGDTRYVLCVSCNGLDDRRRTICWGRWGDVLFVSCPFLISNPRCVPFVGCDELTVGHVSTGGTYSL